MNRKLNTVVPRSLFIFSIFAFILFGSKLWALETEGKIVSTSFGNFPITSPLLKLSVLPTLPMFDYSSPDFPKLLKWQEYSESPGWFITSAEDHYREGLFLMGKSEWNKSLEEFDVIINENSNSPFYPLSLFWKSQLLIKTRNYESAIKVLQKVIALNRQFKYLIQSGHALIWLTVKQGNYSKSLEYIDQFADSIFTPVSMVDIYPLKIYSHYKLKQWPVALESLVKFLRLLPARNQSLQYVIQEAELNYRLNNWDRVADLVNSHWDKNSNHDLQTKLILIGAANDIMQKNWKGAQDKVIFLNKSITGKNKFLLQSTFYLNIWTGNFQKALSGLELFSSPEIKGRNLRQLFHTAYLEKQFPFLIDTKFDTSLFASWIKEAFWILGYAYEQENHPKQAYIEYQKSLSDAEKDHAGETILFNIVVLELISNNFAKANEHLNQIVVNFSESPNISEYFFWYGVTQSELKSRFAPLTLKQVHRSSDRNDDSLFLLERWYQASENIKKSSQYFLDLKTNFPQSIYIEQAFYYHGKSLYDLTLYNDAHIILNEWKQNHNIKDISEELGLLYAQVLVKLQKYDEANLLLGSIVDKYNSFELIQLQIKVLNFLNKHQQVVDFISFRLDKTLSKEQKAYLLFNRAEASSFTSNKEEALLYYYDALKIHEDINLRHIQYQIAKLSYETKQFDDFLNMSSHILDSNSRDDLSNNILVLLGEYYSQQGNKRLEALYLRRLTSNYEFETLKKDISTAKQVELLLNIAKINNRLGLYHESDQVLNQIIALDNSIAPFEVYKEKGYSAFQEKRYEDALSSYLKIIILDLSTKPTDKFDIFRKVAYSYEQINLNQEAILIYQKMLNEFKDEQAQSLINQQLNRLLN